MCTYQHMTLSLLRAVMCCYEQQVLPWVGDMWQVEQEEEGEEEVVQFHRGRESLIYPRKAQRSRRRTRRAKLIQKKAGTEGLRLRFLLNSDISVKTFRAVYTACN